MRARVSTRARSIQMQRAARDNLSEEGRREVERPYYILPGNEATCHGERGDGLGAGVWRERRSGECPLAPAPPPMCGEAIAFFATRAAAALGFTFSKSSVPRGQPHARG